MASFWFLLQRHPECLALYHAISALSEHVEDDGLEEARELARKALEEINVFSRFSLPDSPELRQVKKELPHYVKFIDTLLKGPPKPALQPGEFSSEGEVKRLARIEQEAPKDEPARGNYFDSFIFQVLMEMAKADTEERFHDKQVLYGRLLYARGL